MGFLVLFSPLLGSGSDCSVCMARCALCICCRRQHESYREARRPMQVPRNSKALAFGHEVTLRGTLAIIYCC